MLERSDFQKFRFVATSIRWVGGAGARLPRYEQIEMAMAGAKFEVVKFDGTGNFGLWQTRVKDLLAQQEILKALRP
ncbi:hypothetical protein Sango_0256700 [Sesamum angolense]|uniref:Uncharacterized protein n=1 Tax=Sesamum angolense TaxID=2727404 RepID=A0AAE1XI33_9LAMI|nr:hypothetical protein Sango_0256700 [Sesamum angolense]